MVLKTEKCAFSGLRVYPGHGTRLTKIDSTTFLFLNGKSKKMHAQKKKPAKLAWTTTYRKAHKKDIEASTRTKKRRVNKSAFTRSLVGASLEVLAKKRNEKPEVRAAARDAALREIKARAAKKKGAKK
ncbi:Ribosomal protein L24, component of cytosolic 80S ribosome and 60S large subunit [Ostreococcus lucimarinus CCE9901]|uniref:Ribosomal protein L24, component of cytosolic 80S ribosome and 60S large subunit n=1 Tax=Ostreococcus lucimarinus (strain CCE9901) TaxID=436017 RepID=A4S7Z4_OSTLU|nr:Ribosomal protein L24, component of cytosolic 80S ribosome and 60S large subunit [Ostreococcus lucimarinus CCE9901]ABO99831.1 Ribosomal protein L24, component of cytosolic 80S ribosome and 60S large subunit [Ostreococcus lucimarinus CCE9901]|eukprot:XP_001421538.1 Ribosomal protein L24, component of cytosolic 80S ribosome and 60S large subunit [Ostreococcus lucimarinus CCE9901]